MAKKILRQGLIISANGLRELADDLESETRKFNLELGEEDLIDFNQEWSLNIINKEPECSDTWRIESITEDKPISLRENKK